MINADLPIDGSAEHSLTHAALFVDLLIVAFPSARPSKQHDKMLHISKN